MQVVANQLMGFVGSAGDVAAHLFTAHPGSRIKGEKAIGRIARLLLQLVEGDAASIDAGRCACFESIGVEAELLERFSEAFGGLLAGTTGRHGLVPHPDAAPQEGAGGEDDALRPINAAEISTDAGDPLLIALTDYLKAGHHCFAQRKVGCVLQQLQHLAAVQAFIGLRAECPDGGTAAGVQDALLDGGGIGEPTDHATKGIHFMDKLALGGSADSRVAGLPGDPIEVEGEQGGCESQSSCGDCCFTARMASPDHNAIEGFGWDGAEAHLIIISKLVQPASSSGRDVAPDSEFYGSTGMPLDDF